MTPSEYKKHQHLDRENLRDHMGDLELIFSMLGEAATTEIARVPKNVHDLLTRVSTLPGATMSQFMVQIAANHSVPSP